MNILMALSQLEVTGAEVYAVTLTNSLIAKGHNVTIVSDTLTKETQAEYIKIEFNKRGLVQRIKQIQTLLKIIKEKDIQVVHAHSRASSWSCEIACKIANIPLITSTHGRQPVHLSRKIFKAFGKETLVVCENIKTHLIEELGVNPNMIKIIRNPIDINLYKFEYREPSQDKTISIIGRLSGPKGDTTYSILEKLQNLKNIKVQVIGGKNIPDKFSKFLNVENIEFVGYVNNVQDYIKNSDIIIGAGRVAVEAILCGKPIIAVGEAQYIGLITQENITEALKSNFGDINYRNTQNFNWEHLIKDVEHGFMLSAEKLLHLRKIIEPEFNSKIIVGKIENIYAESYVKTKKYEIPVIMYHRVIKDKADSGVHGIYVTEEQFEQHLKYLKEKNYQTITFKELLNNKYKNRFDKGKKYVILTFDDGYEDNYKYAFPLLKKYNFKCVIYLVSDLKYNKWDVDNPTNPEKKFPLMNLEMIKEMEKYGIEFGGHTKTHPRLSKIPLEEAANEILESKATLEKKLNHELISFAYPYGDLNEKVKQIVAHAGYHFAVATDSGDICFSKDLYQIRRIGIFSTNNMLTFKRKVSGKYNFIKIKREEKEKKNYK